MKGYILAFIILFSYSLYSQIPIGKQTKQGLKQIHFQEIGKSKLKLKDSVKVVNDIRKIFKQENIFFVEVKEEKDRISEYISPLYIFTLDKNILTLNLNKTQKKEPFFYELYKYFSTKFINYEIIGCNYKCNIAVYVIYNTDIDDFYVNVFEEKNGKYLSIYKTKVKKSISLKHYDCE